MVIVLVLIFVVDPVIAGLLEGVGQFTLTGLGIAMSGGDNDGTRRCCRSAWPPSCGRSTPRCSRRSP